MLHCFLLALGLWLLPPREAAWRAFHLTGYAQGTTYAITYYAADSVVTSADVARQLAEIDASLSLYQPGSLINQFNAAARGVVADRHLQVVVRKALQVYQDTDGRFDATVEPLVRAWGSGTQHTDAPPSPAAIQAILKSVGSNKIHLRGDSLVKDQPAVHPRPQWYCSRLHCRCAGGPARRPPHPRLPSGAGRRNSGAGAQVSEPRADAHWH